MKYVLISQCRGCMGDSACLESVLVMDPMPLAGGFCATSGAASVAPVFPLTWLMCHNCGLVQVAEDIPDTVLFSEYQYASSKVGGLVRHFESYARFLRERYGENAELNFCEIGCNDGVLLNLLPSQWNLVGIDPSDIAKHSVSGNSNYRLYNVPFSEQLIDSNELESQFNVISGSNCFAHVSDLNGMFRSIHRALRDGGHFWLEVHDVEALLQGAQWDTIYHEHKAEWGEDSLLRCLLPLGFSHLATHRLPLHGGILRIGLRKEKQPQSFRKTETSLKSGLDTLCDAYRNRYETSSARLLRRALRDHQKLAAYGASGRANVYLNQMTQLHFEFIVDESPTRMNKFIPRVGVPILSKDALLEKPTRYCLITAWNYKEDIVRKNPEYAGEWLTAFGES